MTIARNILSLLVPVLLLITLSGCQEKGVPVQSISLDKASLNLKVGESYSFAVTVNPSNADEQTVLWESSDMSVAIVKDGNVQAVSPGKAVVTAKVGVKSASCDVTVSASVTKFYKGTTMCFASYVQDLGLVYRENGSPKDPYKSVKDHGGNIVRLQLDQVEFAKYNGATIDWQSYSRVLADAKKAKDAGLEIFLTLKPDYDQYTETSSHHNLLPSAWASKSDAEIGQLLYDWVYSTLENLAKEKIFPAIVAVGNEVNVGFLKPSSSSAADASRTGKLLSYGFKAVRDYAKKYNASVLSAIHLADPSKAMAVLQTMESAGAVDYDIIALSYYPGKDIGHTLPNTTVKNTCEAFQKKYSKPVMIVETAYSFTTGSVGSTYKGDYCNNAYNYPDWNDATNATNYTPKKQREWLKGLAQEVKDGGGVGLITWGTESLPDELTGKETGHGKGLYTYPASWGYGSTWENNSYWDFTSGNNLHEGIDWMKDVQ